MKVIKSTGLVPVKMLVNALPYLFGNIHGFFPARASAMVQAGEAEFVEIPDDIETEVIDVAIPAEKKEPAALDPRDAVEIPDNWQDMNILKMVKLAKSFVETVDSKETADAAIKAELDRRTKPQ